MTSKSKSILWIILIMTFIFSIMVLGQEPGSLLWKFSADWHVHSISATGDIDGDSSPDVFVGSGDNRVYCISGGGANKGSIIWSWALEADIWTVASLSDINGDGIDECLAGSGDNTIYCFNGKPDDGLTSIRWSYTVSGDIWTVSSINDINGDGINDCIAGTGDDQVICLDGAWGLLIWSYTDIKKGAIKSVMAITDVNGDGKDDCLAGSENNEVMCISGGSSVTGTKLWAYQTKSTVLSVTSIDDVNGDGISDCLAAGEDNSVYCISGKNTDNGSVIWSYQTGSTVLSVGTLADVNGDGKTDCIAGGLDDYVYCFSGANGSLVWSFKTGSTVRSVFAIDDVNGTGGEDCIAGGEADKIYCLEGKSSGPGELIWSYDVNGTINQVTSVKDISGNGLMDVLGASNDSYVYALEGGRLEQENISVPSVVTGPTTGKVGQMLGFAASNSISNLGHTLEYRFDWGNGTFSDWGSSSQNYVYNHVDNYNIKAQARCSVHTDIMSDWSVAYPVTVSGHILTVNVVGSGNVARSPEKTQYDNNEVVKLTAKAATWFQFDNWAGDISGSDNPINITMNTDKTITASFKETTENISTPDLPSGPAEGLTGESITFSTGGSNSSLNHQVEYRFDWDDGSFSDWGNSVQSHIWANSGTFEVKAQARCVSDPSVLSNWSNATTLTVNTTGVESGQPGNVPTDFQLLQNYPNPFNNQTCITFQLPSDCEVQCDIVNLNGELVTNLVTQYYQAGTHRLYWNGKNHSGQNCTSAIYLYTLNAGVFKASKWMILIK